MWQANTTKSAYFLCNKQISIIVITKKSKTTVGKSKVARKNIAPLYIHSYIVGYLPFRLILNEKAMPI